MPDSSGRVGCAETSSRPSDEAACASSPYGFDPARFSPSSYDGKPRHMQKARRRELDALLNAARSHIEGLTEWRRRQLFEAFMAVSPINCSWQHYALAKIFIYEVAAIATEARRAVNAEGGAIADEGAGLEEASPKPHRGGPNA